MHMFLSDYTLYNMKFMTFAKMFGSRSRGSRKRNKTRRRKNKKMTGTRKRKGMIKGG